MMKDSQYCRFLKKANNQIKSTKIRKQKEIAESHQMRLIFIFLTILFKLQFSLASNFISCLEILLITFMLTKIEEQLIARELTDYSFAQT